jgi:hypothetical protein
MSLACVMAASALALCKQHIYKNKQLFSHQVEKNLLCYSKKGKNALQLSAKGYKVQWALEQAMKAQRGSTGIALLFL